MASSRIFLVTTLAALVVSVTDAISLKGAGAAGVKHNDANSLPVRQQYHRQGQVTNVLSTLPGLDKKENTDSTTATTKEKVLSKEDKIKKQKEEASKFDALVASNDCQSKITATKQVAIECLSTASSSSTSGTVGKDKKASDKAKKNKINFDIRTGKDGISVTVKYDDDTTIGTNTNTQYEIAYDRIVEYQKSSGGIAGLFSKNDNENATAVTASDLAYEYNKDKIIQTVQLDSWDDIEELTIDSSSNSAKYYSAATKDGNIKFNFFVNQAVAGQDITNNKLKIDFWLTSFPWRKSSDSYLALLSTVTSDVSKLGYKLAGPQAPIDTLQNAVATADDVTATDAKESKKDAKDKKSKTVNIIFQDYDEKVTAKDKATATETSSLELPVGEYKWATTARTFRSSSTATSSDGDVAVDSIEEPVTSTTTSKTTDVVSVIATSPSNENDKTFQIAFSFIGPAGSEEARTIYWDPETGVAYASSNATIVSSDEVIPTEGVDSSTAIRFSAGMTTAAAAILSSILFLVV